MNFTKETLLVITLACALNVFPSAKAWAAAGDLYQAKNPDPGAIYRFSPAGGAPVSFASALSFPGHIAFNRSGDLFCNEGLGSSARITKITSAGVKSTFASGVDARGLAV